MNYARHYEALMCRARSRKLTGHIERHHVVPRCLGGGEDQSNIVMLTPEEHFVAHQLLVKLNPGNYKLATAAVMMALCNHDNPGRGNKLYGWLRRRAAKACEKWRHPRCDQETLFVWACAGRIFDFIQRYPTAGSHRVKRALQLPKSPKTVIDRIRTGWLPYADGDWVEFSKGWSLPPLYEDARARVDEDPWNSCRGVTEQWAVADVIFDYYQRFPRDGSRRMLAVLGLDVRRYQAQVLNRIRAGWNPHEDSAWCSWVKTVDRPRTSDPNCWDKLRNEKKKNPLKGINPWEHPLAKTERWAQADVAYQLFTTGVGYVKLSQLLGGSRQSWQPIVNKFKRGWDPEKDPKWVAWRTNLKEGARTR